MNAAALWFSITYQVAFSCFYWTCVYNTSFIYTRVLASMKMITHSCKENIKKKKKKKCSMTEHSSLPSGNVLDSRVEGRGIDTALGQVS